jgi:hypothetical protein
LLVAAGLIPTQTLQAALTLQNATAVHSSRPKIGEILVNSGALKYGMIDAAVKLQELARKGLISPLRINEVLSKVQATGATPEQILRLAPPPMEAATPGANKSPANHMMANDSAAVEPRPVSRGDALLEQEARVSAADRDKLKQVLELLKDPLLQGADGASRAHLLLGLFKQAAIVKQSDIDLTAPPGSHILDAVKAVLVKELIDANTFKAGIDCLRLLADERLKREQAIIALLYCYRSRVNLRDAIIDMNWLINVDDIK